MLLFVNFIFFGFLLILSCTLTSFLNNDCVLNAVVKVFCTIFAFFDLGHELLEVDGDVLTVLVDLLDDLILYNFHIS